MIYLMRHGSDDPDRLGGWSRYGLTEEGIRQVNAAKEKLIDKNIEKIFSSDLKRARETAEIIAEFLGLPVTFSPQFRETNNGVLAGMLKAEAKEKYPELYWSALDWTQAYPGGESPEAFYTRIEKAWREFKTNTKNKTVLLVSHGGVMNVILCIEKNILYTNKEMRFQISNAGIVCIK